MTGPTLEDTKPAGMTPDDKRGPRRQKRAAALAEAAGAGWKVWLVKIVVARPSSTRSPSTASSC